LQGRRQICFFQGSDRRLPPQLSQRGG
jgi:hypothetical protein